MANTTNFGWETPDDTDLVKDGASAMRTLGNAIDTSLVDLKGGTTGQVLSKASNTDMDFTWVADQTGKIKQIITASTTTSTAVASTTFTDTTLTATITPTSASSTILIMINQYAYQNRLSSSSAGGIQILRGATSIHNAEYASRIVATGATEVGLAVYTNLIYRDSPATTSSTTYKTQGKVTTTANSNVITFELADVLS